MIYHRGRPITDWTDAEISALLYDENDEEAFAEWCLISDKKAFFEQPIQVGKSYRACDLSEHHIESVYIFYIVALIPQSTGAHHFIGLMLPEQHQSPPWPGIRAIVETFTEDGQPVDVPCHNPDFLQKSRYQIISHKPFMP